MHREVNMRTVRVWKDGLEKFSGCQCQVFWKSSFFHSFTLPLLVKLGVLNKKPVWIQCLATPEWWNSPARMALPGWVNLAFPGAAAAKHRFLKRGAMGSDIFPQTLVRWPCQASKKGFSCFVEQQFAREREKERERIVQPLVWLGSFHVALFSLTPLSLRPRPPHALPTIGLRRGESDSANQEPENVPGHALPRPFRLFHPSRKTCFELERN